MYICISKCVCLRLISIAGAQKIINYEIATEIFHSIVTGRAKGIRGN